VVALVLAPRTDVEKPTIAEAQERRKYGVWLVILIVAFASFFAGQSYGRNQQKHVTPVACRLAIRDAVVVIDQYDQRYVPEFDNHAQECLNP
jgi:hypothetical protein